jgi:hypothetical protein
MTLSDQTIQIVIETRQQRGYTTNDQLQENGSSDSVYGLFEA